VSTSVLIVSPYAARANNGNWRTAARWSSLLRPDYQVIVRTAADVLHDADVLVALHARRSHAAIETWCRRTRRGACVLVLTGTDLYHDIPQRDQHALHSLRLADRLIVLQSRGTRSLPRSARRKATVVYQSAPALAPLPKSSRSLRAVFVGHIREEKDPLTFVHAAAALAGRDDIAFAVAGGARDPGLTRKIERLAAKLPQLTMLGELSHAAARQRIRRAHLLVVPSRMEGGANVIVEAVMSGTAVLASDCDGNIGMLGDDYPGYFSVGDASGLAQLITRCRDEPTFSSELARRCALRAREFEPAAERTALLQVLATLRRQ
jgi:putative glycosyltransferase (TIGR04348 family)